MYLKISMDINVIQNLNLFMKIKYFISAQNCQSPQCKIFLALKASVPAKTPSPI